MKKEDLRIKKTKQAIRSAFNDMICEMDYNEITVKELAARAQINRKTFYLHYESIDALMEELEREIIDAYLNLDVSYANFSDIKSLIRFYFEHASKLSKVHERIFCCASYRGIFEKINREIMDGRRKKNKGIFKNDIYYENIIYTYYGSITSILYRQWVEDGKRLSLDEIIELSTNLICYGMSSVYTQNKEHS